jgi:prevent-host-death family protein
MTKSLSTAQIKAHLSESINLAIQEGFVTITRYGKPVAAIVSYEDLKQLKRLRAGRLGGGMTNLAEDWEDAEEFAQQLNKVVEERHQNIL